MHFQKMLLITLEFVASRHQKVLFPLRLNRPKIASVHEALNGEIQSVANLSKREINVF